MIERRYPLSSLIRAIGLRCGCLLLAVVLGLVLLSSHANASKLMVEADEPAQQVLKGIALDFSTIEKSLSLFVERNLYLEREVKILIQTHSEAFVDTEAGTAYVPVSALINLYESIRQRYPEQSAVREQLMTAAVKQLYWQQLVRLLIGEFELPIEGEEIFVLDGFVILMLLRESEGPYILDAAQELLQVDRHFPVFSADSYRDEAEFDEARYQNMACLVLGRDYESYEGLISSLAWEQSRLNICQKKYAAELKLWKLSLQAFLKDESPLRRLSRF